MLDNRFHYDENLLGECNRSTLADFVFARTTTSSRAVELDQNCILLFSQHASHYTLHDEAQESHKYLRHDEKGGYIISDSLRNFVRNAVFVHEHNQQPGNGFTVTLNRFAHLDLDSVLVSDDDSESHQRYLRTQSYGYTKNDTVGDKDTVFEELSEQRIYEIAADLAVGHGAYNKMNPKKHKKKKKRYYENLPDVAVEMPMQSQDPFEATYVKDAAGDGALFSLRSNPNLNNHRNHHEVVDANNDKRSFSTYINWATHENPDGVPIVHDPFDQGSCGSCWAFAAAGSLEASAARHEASLSFQDSTNGYHNISNEVLQEAIVSAQSVEIEAFQTLNLSIQELLDCDTAADQGCTGGNPLLAFYFIHRYGLASWEDYPYTGSEDTCNKQRVRKPVASVRSWGVISPNHENHMELALRYIGPIAVGINGGDHSFLTYSGGIFDSSRCRQGANHALLIVGYGQDAENRWWLARNSWGKGWGENGFVRIARRDGSKGVPGVCGIARSPSVALGGFLLEREASLNSLSHSDFFRGSVETLQFSPSERVCQFLRLSLEGKCGGAANWIDYHHAYVVGFLGLFLALLSIWPLSSDWRRRRRVQRQRKDRQDIESNQKKVLPGSEIVDETTALLC